MRFNSIVVLIVMASGLFVGCNHEEESGQNVPLDKVPQKVMEVAKQKLPNITFEQAWTTPTGNYEVRGRDKNGKVRDIQIKPTGDIVEVD